jgi:hypothetical protein
MLRSLYRFTLWAVWLFLTLFALLSFFRYSTAGLDFEWAQEEGTYTRYFRVRWDLGSTWVGMADQVHPQVHDKLDWFDPGGTLLAAPTPIQKRSFLERLGFWFVGSAAQDRHAEFRYPGVVKSFWLAMPSWLLLLLLWGRSLRRLVLGKARLI